MDRQEVINQTDLIIPTRNRIQDLLVTLEYMTDLGIPQQQIYIVDDASEDDTEATVKQQYPEVHIKRNKTPQGVIYNRNYLWDRTSRKYVLSLDDDSNIISLNDLLTAVEVLEEDEKNGVFAFQIKEQKEPPKPVVEGGHQVYAVRAFIACGCVFKRNMMQTLGNYSREALVFHGEELDCAMRIYKAGFRIVTRQDMIVHHRIDWKERRKAKKTNTKKGVYGANWRSASGFSGHLIIAALYYPLGWDILYMFVYSLKRCYNFLIKKRDVVGYFWGLYRFMTFLPYIFREQNKMSSDTFNRWRQYPVV